MGFSRPYQVFAGLGEVLAGLLICSRRTLALGCLVGIAVMANVTMLNFAYDVGVKLASSFYLLAFVYLLSPDLPRIARALLPEDSSASATPQGGSRSRRLSFAGRWAFALAASWFMVTVPLHAWGNAHAWGQWAPKSALYGLYDVVAVREAEHVERPDSGRWSRIAIGQSRSTIRTVNGTLGFFIASVDAVAGTVRFVSRDEPGSIYELGYVIPHPDSLVLSGALDGDSITMMLARRDEKAYRLVSHPFHWAQNTAENR